MKTILLKTQLSLITLLIFSVLLITPPLAVSAQSEIIPPGDSVIVPDRFLRTWDTVTIFFSQNLGKGANQAEDAATRFVTLKPSHPGAYTWLDKQTLQFKPAEPWPPLTRFGFTLNNKKTVHLNTLMSPPISTAPKTGSVDLAPFDDIHIDFQTPIDIKNLKKMIKLELRQLPGLDSKNSRWLDQRHFSIKIKERSSRSNVAGYVIQLKEKIPQSTKLLMHLRLSLDDKVEQAFQILNFSTKTPLHVTHMGCNNNLLPVPPSGVRYDKQQALRCSSYNRGLEVHFSAPVDAISQITARNLVRITPGVENLRFETQGRKIKVKGNFEASQIYNLRLAPTKLKDKNNQTIHFENLSEAYFSFVPSDPYLKFEMGRGMVERYGPKMLPIEGAGHERLDVRIYPVKALDLSLWPFPNTPIAIDESIRPPSPGEEPSEKEAKGNPISGHQLQQQIRAMGSPSVSKIVNLPLTRSSNSANFGLDLSPLLASIKREQAPGTYLVGVRKLDHSKKRLWARIQVTDLSLSTVEETKRIGFVVNSLSNGKPIAGASITVQGYRRNNQYQWEDLVSGTTDSSGKYFWQSVQYHDGYPTLTRVIVQKGNDILVINPQTPPERFHNNYWSKSGFNWLRLVSSGTNDVAPKPKNICHVFTERPVYKPEDPVFISAYLRSYLHGKYEKFRGEAIIDVSGPGGLNWRYTESISAFGSVHKKFTEPKLPTGHYSVKISVNKTHCASVNFRKEDFRLPKFELNLNAPTETALDKPFDVNLYAKYYAGGKVSKRPVRWRVTQFPYNWTPAKKEDFFYSTDSRFSNMSQFQANPAMNKNSQTDNKGSTSLEINPALEPSAQPRTYVVEATLTGADDQTVSSTARIHALPPFVLALKTPRFLAKPGAIKPQFFVAGANGDLLADQSVTVRLVHRQWHSHLEASDFSSGKAKYKTEAFDKTLVEETVLSSKTISQLNWSIEKAGVYIIELESYDKLGRVQTVSVDFFVSGKQSVTWSEGPKKVFNVATDKKSYEPGQIAKIILQSPYQQARALAVVERPGGQHHYQWVNINNGAGEFELMIEAEYLPRIPVHFLLIRGREKNSNRQSQITSDLQKPTTLAATTWVTVEPVENTVKVELDYAKKAQPGDRIQITIKLSDHKQKRLDGEVTLWLVDQAVLALGKEQRLDPLPDFIQSRNTYLNFNDTRNQVLGHIPFVEQVGGGFSAKREAKSLLDKVTVRKNFRPVIFLDPIIVGSNGERKVWINLPDNLTNFKIRAKAVSGNSRFGYAKGHLAVRLPVIVQPSLPRFVRPGDQFMGIALGRIVEGPAGEGLATLKADGLQVQASSDLTFEWDPLLPKRLEFPMVVPTPSYNSQGELERDKVNITMAVQRNSDGAKDAFSVDLPIKPDQKIQTLQEFHTLEENKTVHIKALDVPVREQGFLRQIVISPQKQVLQLHAGLNYLMNYPHGCTEQRISRARAIIAGKQFEALMGSTLGVSSQGRLAVEHTLAWIGDSLNPDSKLIAYWPGARGYVSLTAWVGMFLAEAQEAGFNVDPILFSTIKQSLRSALRSNYPHLLEADAYSERVWALIALLNMGEYDSSYAAELARKEQYLNLESTAQIAYALGKNMSIWRFGTNKTVDDLNEKMWNGLIFRLHQGNKIYAGLQAGGHSSSPLILPSETRTLAQVLKAVSLTEDHKNEQLIVNALTTLGKSDGWGSTNANAEALLALTHYIKNQSKQERHFKIRMQQGASTETLEIDSMNGLVVKNLNQNSDVKLELIKAADGLPLMVKVQTKFLNKNPGSHIEASATGFVVNRELLHVLEDQPMNRIALTQAASEVNFNVGDVIEEHVEVVNPEDRHYVAVVVPLAAGLEPLNPNLETSPAEAKPENQLTVIPTYVEYRDHQVAFYFDSLKKGNYHFYFRSRASIPGQYSQPSAYAEMMYRESVRGRSHGARIVVQPEADDDSQ